MRSVRRAALGIARTVPGYVDRDDMVSAAYLGLAEALKRLGPEEGPTFESYALQRARGAVLDFLRSCDLLTRGERATARHIAEVTLKLTSALGREPAQEEIEATAGPHVPAALAMEPAHVPLPDVELACNDAGTLEALLDTRREAAGLRRAMMLLSPRLRRVLDLFYFQDARLHEIGAALGVSESRACQLRRLAISELKLCSVLFTSGRRMQRR